MTDTLQTIKQRVRELSPYSLSRARARIKLNQNENPWDAPLRIKEEVLRRLDQRRWSQYPDFVPESLHQRLAELGLPPGTVETMFEYIDLDEGRLKL